MFLDAVNVNKWLEVNQILTSETKSIWIKNQECDDEWQDLTTWKTIIALLVNWFIQKTSSGVPVVHRY